MQRDRESCQLISSRKGMYIALLPLQLGTVTKDQTAAAGPLVCWAILISRTWLRCCKSFLARSSLSKMLRITSHSKALIWKACGIKKPTVGACTYSPRIMAAVCSPCCWSAFCCWRRCRSSGESCGSVWDGSDGGPPPNVAVSGAMGDIWGPVPEMDICRPA